MLSRALRIAPFLLLLSCFSIAQSAPKVAPLPYDPLELATGPTVVPNTPEQRATILSLLERARQNSAMHTPGTAPFSLKVSFNSAGADSHNQGYGEVEETWLNGQTWRWSARVGDYSQLRIFHEGVAYDDKPRGHMPLRLQMVRNAVFWPMAGNYASSLMRMATAKWEGTDIACILISRGGDDSATSGRRWEESEYCIDPKTGLLRIHSEAPGIYSVYDYDGGIAFHGRTLPRRTTIVEGGATVLQIHLDSLEDANNDPEQFVPTKKMMSHGPGAIMVGPFRFPETVAMPTGFSGEIKPVIVHAILDQKGKVLDAEVVESSDPALASAALGVVWHSSYLPGQRFAYLPGERSGQPMQREAFINVKFTPAL